ncbi:MAG TPA: hypothetical protein VHB48_09400 [Chitinophagaceae bacterium]|jgi:hypothetical protein|nr:hypothetical protein [Chitinophagaceae bacterium]
MIKAFLLGDLYMPAITLVVYLSAWKSIQKKEWLILVYCIFNIVLFSITDIMAEYGIHNAPLYHINSLVELWMVSYYLLKKIAPANFKMLFWGVGIIYTAFFFVNVALWEDWSVFNSNSAGVTSLIILFLSMYYLLALSKTDDILYFQRLPSFWIVSGFLIYNAASVLVLLSYKYFTYIHMPNEANRLWFVLSAAIIIKFVLISTGLLCHRKRQATHLPFLL